MKKLFILLILTLFFPFKIDARAIGKFDDIKIFGGLEGGYYGGSGGLFRLSIFNLSKSIPLAIDFGASYFIQEDPGNAEEARRIFINDNQGGTIQKEGYSYIYFFNLRYQINSSKRNKIFLFFGGRYHYYKAHFAYIGDNEAFDVKSNPWGIGGGMNINLRLSKLFFISITGGLDYYPATKIEGHGQFYYTPDKVDENPRNAYTYDDADNAINQPKTVFSVLIGLHYRLY